MSARNIVNGDICRGQCFKCDMKCFDRTVVFFGPGAFIKCGKCGSWTPEEMAEASGRLELAVALAPTIPDTT